MRAPWRLLSSSPAVYVSGTRPWAAMKRAVALAAASAPAHAPPVGSKGSGWSSPGKVRSRMFFFWVRTAMASSVKPGATTHSTKSWDIRSAVASVTGRFSAMTEPKALTGSQRRALS